VEKDYDAAQVFADSARSVDQYNTDLVTLQTNIEFQKLRAEEEERYAVLEEGRQRLAHDRAARDRGSQHLRSEHLI